MKKEIIILSLGGSLIVPPVGIDWQFLRKFRALVIRQIKAGQRFVIVTGGGQTARQYQQAANKVVRLTRDDSDWMGIHATRLNAHLVKTIFRDYAHPRINKNPRTKEDLGKNFSKGEGMMVAAGWRPGWSTDFVAVILAERLKAKTVINISNFDHVCDKDPNKFADAKPIGTIDWPRFRRLVGSKWDPGLNTPFDPVASALAEKNRLQVKIVNGRKLANLGKCLRGEKFQGTTIG